MRTEFSKRRNIFMARYSQNAVMHLILACGVAYILLQSVKIIFLITSDTPRTVFNELILPQIALQPWSGFIRHPWTLLTYFWVHASFFNMLSNMLWIYCFGSVIQSFVGHREVIPLFVVSNIVGALIFTGISFFWPSMPATQALTALPGVTALAIGAFILVPRYRFYLGEHFSIPLWVVLIVFLAINVLSIAGNTGLMVLIATAGLAGAAYMWLLKAGYQPGAKLSGLGQTIQSVFNPDYRRSRPASRRRQQALKHRHHPKSPTPEYIDMLLDKINQKGYASLSSEEKETLIKASRDNQ